MDTGDRKPGTAWVKSILVGCSALIFSLLYIPYCVHFRIQTGIFYTGAGYKFEGYSCVFTLPSGAMIYWPVLALEVLAIIVGTGAISFWLYKKL